MFISNELNLTFGHKSHRPRSEIKYQPKNDRGKSLTFSFLKIIRRLLLFARLSYYFTPVLGSQSLPRSSRLPFWPAGFILPPIIENLLIYFFSNMDPLGAGAPRSLMGNGHMETTHFKKGLPLFVCWCWKKSFCQALSKQSLPLSWCENQKGESRASSIWLCRAAEQPY